MQMSTADPMTIPQNDGAATIMDESATDIVGPVVTLLFGSNDDDDPLSEFFMPLP